MRTNAWVPVTCALCLAVTSRSAQAACSETGASLGCFDATPGQGPADPSAFRWFAEGKVLPWATQSLGMHWGFANRPLELVAPAADPAGRRVVVVKQTSRLELRAASGLGRGLDVSAALPFALDQAGAGSEALSTQRPTTIDRASIGDIRVSLRTRLPEISKAAAWNLRFELSVPTGNDRAYVGEPSFAETLATNLGLTLGPWLFVADLGIRVTKQRRFADIKLGPQLLAGIGIAYRVLPKELLTVSVESQLRPALTSSPALKSTESVPTTVHATSVIPAEWMANVSSRTGELPLWVSVGAGTALALSRRETTDSRLDQRFIAPTTPRWRLAFSAVVRF